VLRDKRQSDLIESECQCLERTPIKISTTTAQLLTDNRSSQNAPTCKRSRSGVFRMHVKQSTGHSIPVAEYYDGTIVILNLAISFPACGVCVGP